MAEELMLAAVGVGAPEGVLFSPTWSSPLRLTGVAYRGEREGDSLGVPGPPVWLGSDQ